MISGGIVMSTNMFGVPVEGFAQKSKEAATEGIVLLKNEGGMLPLTQEDKISVFGRPQIEYYRSGTGSGGAVNVEYATNILDGFENSNLNIDETLVEKYKNWLKDHPFDNGGGGWACEPWFQKDMPIDEAFAKEQAAKTNKALYIIGRTAGEDKDNAIWQGSYILTDEEKENLRNITKAFDNVCIVLNVSNIIDLSWINDEEYNGSIKSVIIVWQGGMEGGTAVVDVLSGAETPSGKLADTIAYSIEDYPSTKNFGNEFKNLYEEDIYIGYRYFETFAPDKVQFEFGYGLSYTTFEQKMNDFSDNGDNVTFNVTVTNTGDVAGKDVVEVYFTPPYTNGGIEKASVNLIDYAKTGEIAPGESETVEFTINKEDMASYDANEIKVAGGGYILEAGEYTVSVRSDSHTVLDQANFTVDSDINYSENARTTDNVAATNQLNDYTAGNVTYLSRADGFANYAEATAAPAEEAYVMDDATRKEVEANSTAYYDSTAYDNAEDTMPTLGSDNGLTLADLTGKAYDDPMWDQLLDQMSFEDMSLLVNLGGWQTAQIDSVGKVATSDCDGPAGVNNFITGTYGTPYPTEVLMAQTWNTDLLYDLGLAMGQEYADVNNYGVYGPAMNTHRSAFAGRNFEYYSEDGVLAGKLAAAQVNAMATKGTYNYIKHFALNDQETNRCAFLLTYSNEQAIREIYLKPFELCIKNFDGTQIAVMSSFNWIGTVPACANEDTLTTILRNEWGFQGMVITDYDGSYGYMITDHCVRTGNDLMLGFSSQASNQLTNTESATLNNALRTSCKNIMYTIANSGYYTNTTDDSGMSNMTKLFVTIDVVTVLLVVLCMALVIVRYRKKHAKTTAEVTPEEKKEE